MTYEEALDFAYQMAVTQHFGTYFMSASGHDTLALERYHRGQLILDECYNLAKTLGIRKLMSTEAVFNHPLFSLAMYRAVNKQERAGVITAQQAGEMHNAFATPLRKNAAGETCDLVNAIRAKVLARVAADPSVSSLPVADLTFNWGNLLSWLEANLPAILSDLEALLSIFVLFA